MRCTRPFLRMMSLALLLGCTGAVAAPVTTGSLIGGMVDMHGLADFPDPSYKTIQFSSYDHRSSHPGGPHWFDNSDGFGGEPVPNFEAVLKEPEKKGKEGEYLVCDVEGPGAIVRQWTARIDGTIRVYLDGGETPVFDGPAQTFFMRPYDVYLEESGLPSEILEDTFYQRNAAYCPFPFANRCRVVWTGVLERTHFYQLQLRRYAPGTEVRAFSPSDLSTYASEIRRVASLMKDPDGAWEYGSTRAAEAFDITVEPGDLGEALTL